MDLISFDKSDDEVSNGHQTRMKSVRIRKPIEKDLENEILSLLKKRRKLELRLTKLTESIQPLLTSPLNKATVEEKLKQISATFIEFSESHKMLCSKLENSDHLYEKAVEEKYFEE